MKLLNSYNTLQQQYGDYFSGFQWTIIGTGTFRRKVSADEAPSCLKLYMRELGLKINGVVPYIAALEHRTGGCGMAAIPRHYHFLAACPLQWKPSFPSIAAKLWTGLLGDNKIAEYHPSLGGAYYMAKLAGQQNFEFVFDGLDRLAYTGEHDLLASTATNPYVPAHAKGISRLRTLVVRDPISRLPLGASTPNAGIIPANGSKTDAHFVGSEAAYISE